MAQSYNPRSPAVKRILQEVREMQRSSDPSLAAGALEDNLFEWQFVVRGPEDTEFQGGLYHGRVQLPPEYPFKPPAFQLCTPNGRFEVGTKVCLSISQHHPEHWQPSWGVRTALTALIAFLPTPGKGALGALDYPAAERRALAAKSRAGPPTFGCPERQQLAAALHQRLLAAERQQGSQPPQASPAVEEGTGAAGASREGPCQGAGPAPTGAPPAVAPQPATVSGAEAARADDGPHPGDAGAPCSPPASRAESALPVAATAATSAAPPEPPATHAELQPALGEGEEAQQQQAAFARQGSMASIVEELQQPVTVVGSWEDAGLTGLAGLLIVGIGAILLRRILIVGGFDFISSLY